MPEGGLCRFVGLAIAAMGRGRQILELRRRRGEEDPFQGLFLLVDLLSRDAVNQNAVELLLFFVRDEAHQELEEQDFRPHQGYRANARSMAADKRQPPLYLLQEIRRRRQPLHNGVFQADPA